MILSKAKSVKLKKPSKGRKNLEKQHLVNAVELLKNELSEVSNRICSLEADLGGENTAKAFEEPLQKILDCVDTLKSSDAIKQLSSMMGMLQKKLILPLYL